MKYCMEIKHISLYHYITHLVNSSDIVQVFGDNFKLKLDTIVYNIPYLIVTLGEFNVKKQNRYEHKK